MGHCSILLYIYKFSTVVMVYSCLLKIVLIIDNTFLQNIFHGNMSLNQLYMTRPTYMNPSFSTPDIKGLYLCGSGAHPGKIYIRFTPTCSHFLTLSLSPSSLPSFLSVSRWWGDGGTRSFSSTNCSKEKHLVFIT